MLLGLAAFLLVFGYIAVILYLLVAIYKVKSLKKDQKDGGDIQWRDVEGDMMNEFKVPEIKRDDNRRKIFFKACILYLILTTLAHLIAFWNGVSSIARGFKPEGMGSFLVLYLFIKWYQKTVLGHYSVYLSDNYIMVESGTWRSPQINRDEIREIEEDLIQLRVVTNDKNSGLFIPKNISGYEEIRTRLLEWTNRYGGF